MIGKIKRMLFIVSLMIIVEFAMSTPIKSEAASSVTLTQLKQKFPAGKYWNHAGQSNNNPDGYTSVPCTHHGNCSKNGYSGWCGCNSFGSSIQCFGFANKLAYDAFGSLYTSWGRTNLNNLKAGDVIRYKNDGHSIFVTGISGDTITYGDCNSDGHCIIRWDAKISKSTVAKTLTAVYSAPAELSINSENNFSNDTYIDLGADFYAYLINTPTWLHATNDDSGNISARTLSYGANQIWHFERLSNGSYKISSCKDGKVMEVHNFESSNGTNVEMKEWSNNSAQRWYIYGSSGCYEFRAECGDCVLDLYGGAESAVSGANLNMWEKNETSAQDFSVWKLDYPDLGTTYATVEPYGDADGNNIKISWNDCREATGYDIRIYPEDGSEVLYTYWNVQGTSMLASIPAGRYQIDVGTLNSRFNAWKIGGKSSFTCYHNESRFYAYLINTTSWLHATNEENGNVTACSLTQRPSQIWYFELQGDGSHKISSCKDGKVLSVHGSDSSAGVNVEVSDWTGDASQKWYISGSSGCFELRAGCGNKVLDLHGGAETATSGTNLSMWDSNGGTAQKFSIWGLENIRGNVRDTNITLGTVNYTYDASPKTPSVTVKNGTTTLVEGTDYTIAYSNNTNAGTATATITGTGSYTGTISRNFTINKANQTVSPSISASAIREGTTAQVTAGGEGTKTYTSSNPSVATVDASGLVTGRTAGTAVITVTAEETGNYFSATATVPVTVTHAYGSGTVTTEATCTQDGVRTYTCSGCGKTYTEAIRAKGHSYAESVTGATCTERGYTTHTCSACGDSYRNLYVDALGHQFDQGVVTKAPTGDTDGIRTYTCSRCRITREETIPATGHTYDNGTVTKEATCMEAGIRTYRCSDCGRTYTEEIPSLGHRYETAVTAPSCTKKGYTTHTCAVCGDSYKDSYTDAAGHSYNDGEVAEEAACTEEGLKIYTCVNCRNQYTELIPASGHQYEERVTAPSCTKKGYTTHTCTVCRYSYKDDYTNALGHSYDEGEIVEEPTCTEEGLQRYTCLRCQNQYTETIAAAGHQYVSIVTEPGCTEKGYTTHACTACGESYQDSYVNATGHDYDEGEVVEEPTCTEEGLQRYTCLRCRNQYTETIAAAGHRWDNGEIITAATASSTGRKMYICGECGEKKIETIPALSDEKEQKPSNPETNTPPQENQTERHLTAGETVSVGSSCYRVTASGKTVEYAGCLMDGITFIGIPKKVVLHGVTYPVTGIADRAFAKNQKLMTVLIPEGVRVIGDAAFENCKSLKKVTIPSSVEKIGKRAFYGCRRLANLTIKTKKLTKKKVGEKAFTKAGSASYKKLKVKVPKVKRKAYQGLLKKKGLSPKAKMK